MSPDMIYPRDAWRHYGTAGHLIVSSDCRFHLHTHVGPWRVSTVGECWPSRASREIHATIYDATWHRANTMLRGDAYDAAYMKRFGFEQVGYNRTYETMVFRSDGPVCAEPDCQCGEASVTSWSELDVDGANQRGEAAANHWRL